VLAFRHNTDSQAATAALAYVIADTKIMQRSQNKFANKFCAGDSALPGTWLLKDFQNNEIKSMFLWRQKRLCIRCERKQITAPQLQFKGKVA
jgi:hypothetical protein